MTGPMVYGVSLTCPLEVAGVDGWLANSEELAYRGAEDAARRAGARPDPAPSWTGWSLLVYAWDVDGNPAPDPTRSRRLTGRPEPADVPPLGMVAWANFVVECEVRGRPAPTQRLANALLALTWRRAEAEYGVTA